MTPQLVIDLAQRALQHVLLLTGPVLLAGMVAGLAVSLFQAVTSIQEATLTFLPKLVVMFVVLLVAMPWMLDLMVRYAADLLGNLGQFTR